MSLCATTTKFAKEVVLAVKMPFLCAKLNDHGTWSWFWGEFYQTELSCHFIPSEGGGGLRLWLAVVIKVLHTLPPLGSVTSICGTAPSLWLYTLGPSGCAHEWGGHTWVWEEGLKEWHHPGRWGMPEEESRRVWRFLGDWVIQLPACLLSSAPPALASLHSLLRELKRKREWLFSGSFPLFTFKNY